MNWDNYQAYMAQVVEKIKGMQGKRSDSNNVCSVDIDVDAGRIISSRHWYNIGVENFREGGIRNYGYYNCLLMSVRNPNNENELLNLKCRSFHYDGSGQIAGGEFTLLSTAPYRDENIAHKPTRDQIREMGIE